MLLHTTESVDSVDILLPKTESADNIVTSAHG